MKSLVLIGCLAFPAAFAFGQITADPAPAPIGGTVTGKVVETMDTAGYTYVLVAAGTNKVWAATMQFAVKVGDSVTFTADDPMANYHSKSLNRDFDTVYFAGRIAVNDGTSGAAGALQVLPPGHPPLSGPAAPVLPPGHPSLDGQAAGPDLDLTGIKPAAGGETIQQIYAGTSTLAGKTVIVRGQVVKYNAMILGKNWLHIRDGSGSPAKNDYDLLVTTGTPAKLGDIVLVTGIVSTNKDFGASYRYDVMLDDAQVTVEQAR